MTPGDSRGEVQEEAGRLPQAVPSAAEREMVSNLLLGAKVNLSAACSSLQWAHDNCADDRIAAAIGRELLNIMQARKLIRTASGIIGGTAGAPPLPSQPSSEAK